MRVFISWSGELSERLAGAIYKWLPATHKFVRPYFSPEDIEKGVKWQDEINKQLEKHNFCIVALTRQNLNSEWIMYEAGAISKNRAKARLWVILFDIQPKDVHGPLASFQMIKFSKDGMRQLLRAINSSGPKGKRISQAILDKTFNKRWRYLERDIGRIIGDYPGSKELDLLASKISSFAGTKFDAAAPVKLTEDYSILIG
jgi:hypothetical protein